ncbi:MAG: hypothetical protein ABJA81_02930 [Nocardioidaceae bacterium]
MSRLHDDLFRMLPLLYQQRDAARGPEGPLRALLEVLGDSGDAVAADLGQLYDDWFIETCADWVVPYLGDLLGVRLLHPVGPGAGRSRALVANTLGYRRRKGTLAVLEQLAYDVTAWPTAAVEYFTRLDATQYLGHRRPANLRTPDFRHAADLELVGGPFDATAHTAEARRLPSGRYGIPNIGLHVWRLAPHRVARGTARQAADPPDGRYRVDPAGLDVMLFNPGGSEDAGTSLAQEHHVPEPLRRHALYDELETLRAGIDVAPRWFADDPVIEVFADLGGGLAAVPASQLTAADLSDQPTPPATGWPRPVAPLVAAVDPVLGRIAFRSDLDPSDVEVTASYASPNTVGSGPFDRTDESSSDVLRRATWFRAVGRRVLPVADAVETTIAAAVDAWNAEPAGTVGVIVVVDSRTYEEDLASAHELTVPAGSELMVIAATWPQAESGEPSLSLAQATPNDRRPHLLGSIAVTGTAGAVDAVPGRLTIDGLYVEGDLTVRAGDLGKLWLRHMTVLPPSGQVTVEPPAAPDSDNGSLDIVVERCLIGPIGVPQRGPALHIRTSVVDAAGADAVDAPESPVSLDATTVLGATRALTLDASDSILDGPVEVERRQAGCLRFSYVEPGAASPRRYRCQPDLAVKDETDPARIAAVRARLSPVFTSTRYGDPAYARLDDRADIGLRTGASNSAAMGTSAELQEPQRESNVVAVMEEYLRLGLEAGVIHQT